jgi:hypothetical protein
MSSSNKVTRLQTLRPLKCSSETSRLTLHFLYEQFIV